MIQKEITAGQFNDIILAAYPKPEKDSKGSIKKWANKVDVINDIYTGEFNGMIAGSAWGAFNALTERLDWYRSARGGNNESILAAEVNATLMRSSSVHSVSIREGKFRIENKNHNVSFVKDIIGANYINKLINKETDTPANLLIPTLHQSKKYLNKFPTFSLNGDNPTLRQKNVFHQLLYTGLFQNSCICLS